MSFAQITLSLKTRTFARRWNTPLLDAARQDDSVVVTLDSDFHRLLAISRATTPSVVRIRIEGLNGEQLAKILGNVINAASAELEAGTVVTVTQSRIRVRSLPIGG